MADDGYDELIKDVTDLLDSWGKAMEKVAKDLKDVKTQMEQIDALQKKKVSLQKDAEDHTKDLTDQLKKLTTPQGTDPKQYVKLPTFITSNINKNGIRINDVISIKPDIDVDLKKMKIKKAGIVLTITF